jgi:hypothetical protein
MDMVILFNFVDGGGMGLKKSATICGAVLLQITGTALAQDSPPSASGQIRVGQEGQTPDLTPPFLPRGSERKFDPFFDLKKSGNGYDVEAGLAPLYSLDVPNLGPVGVDADLNDYYGVSQAKMTAELRDRAQAIKQYKTVSLGAMSCGLGLSFANCDIPKSPCNFALGVFDLNSRSAVARDDHAFSFLSNHCSF